MSLSIMYFRNHDTFQRIDIITYFYRLSYLIIKVLTYLFVENNEITRIL